MSSVTVATQPRRVLADVVPGTLLADTALVVGGAALVGALAQITIHLGFTPVPVTGQTLGVLLCGSALGWRRASLSMGLYIAAGLAGLPWFAGHASGYPVATFGYLLGFVLAGSVLGWLASRGNDRNVIRGSALRDCPAVARGGPARLVAQGSLARHDAVHHRRLHQGGDRGRGAAIGVATGRPHREALVVAAV